MPKVLPFHGVRFDWKRVPLKKALCPPYDVIGDKLAKRLRAIPYNTIHLELPEGGADKYANAAKTWKRWQHEGVLIRDLIPAYYVIEQTFQLGGKRYTRRGFLSALRLDEASKRQVTPHEKTFSKPKQDRLNLLDAVKAQISPVFALYEDKGGRVAQVLRAVTARPPAAEGLAPDGVTVRVWRALESDAVAAIAKTMENKQLLIADGHHRTEVARQYGCRSVLCYVCSEDDPGIRVLPTHRVAAKPEAVLARLQASCKLSTAPSLAALETKIGRHPSPFAFGVVTKAGAIPGRFSLAVPSPRSARGIKSGLGVEWLSKRLFSEGDSLLYTHDSREAVSMAGGSGAAFLVKPVEVPAIRKAVNRIGLLPQKSTYFFPKVEAGIVFNEID